MAKYGFVIVFRDLQEELGKAKKLLYLTDNCGEIVIKERYPQLSVTVMVRGKAVINDATEEDAIQVGMTEITRVVNNGTGIAGTCLEQMPEVPFQEVDEADVIIAKGHGNYETLRGCDRNVFYLFLCKCEMFGKILVFRA